MSSSKDSDLCSIPGEIYPIVPGSIEVTSTGKVRKDISGEGSFEFQKIKLPILSSFALSIP
jgi:hypothetical protein